MKEPERRASVVPQRLGVGRRVRRVKSPRSWPQACTLLGFSQGMVWILSRALAHSPLPLSLTRIIYLKRETKQGGMLSCVQCTNSVQCEKTIVENLNQFFFAAEHFFEIAFGGQGKRQRQMEAEGLETGYADRGRRFVRLLHPAVDIIAIQEKKKTIIPFYGTSVKWLSEAEGSPILLSC